MAHQAALFFHGTFHSCRMRKDVTMTADACLYRYIFVSICYSNILWKSAGTEGPGMSKTVLGFRHALGQITWWSMAAVT